MGVGKCCDTYGFVCHIFLICVAIAGVVFSALTVFSCDFLETNQPPILEDSGITAPAFNFGLIYFEDPTNNGECTLYPDTTQFSAAAQCARVSAIIAPLCGLIALFFYLFEFFFCRFCCARCIQASFLGAAEIAQGLTFIAFGTEEFCQFPYYGNTCSISTGAIYSIVAFACFFIVGCIGCCSPKPEPMLKRCSKKEEKDDDDDDHAEPKVEEVETKGDEEEAKVEASAPMYDAAAY